MAVANEAIIRFSSFLFILVVMMVLESIIPRRKPKFKKVSHWFGNLVLVLINTLILRLFFPAAAVGVAIWCEQNSVGILNIFGFSGWLKSIIAFLVLDFAIYLQHVLFHYLPILWKFHKVHHADLDFDVTTGLRFHPIEIIISMLIKFVVICSIGAPALAVMVFEIVLNATSLFNHGNIKLPRKLDKFLRYIIVPPDVHRVHHSTIPKEINSNFGFNLIVWDKLFGTYRAKPKLGHTGMNIGIDEYRNADMTQKLINMLKMPFLK